MNKIKQFVAPYSFKEFYSKYPEGYTIYEALLEWLNQVNEMVDVLNITQSEWENIKLTILEEVKQYSIDQLQTWLADGTLEQVINTALFESKADKVELDSLETEFIQARNEINTLNQHLEKSDTRFYNIKHYGMKENEDISVALQQLINQIHSDGGGQIFFPTGDWLIGRSGDDSSSGILLKSNVAIIGEDRDKTRLYKTNLRHGNGFFYGTNLENVTIQNLTITTKPPITYKDTTIRIQNSNGATIERVNFIDIKGSAIRISDNKNFILRDLTFKNIDGDELEGSGVGGQCVYALNVENGLIDNIRAEDIGDHVIYFDTTETGVGKDYVIRNVYAKNTGTNGVTAGACFNIVNNQRDFIVENVVLERVKQGFRLGNNGGFDLQPLNFVINNIRIISTTLGSAFHIHKGTENGRATVYGVINNVVIGRTGIDDTTHSPFGIRMERIVGIQFNNITFTNTGYQPIRLRGCQYNTFNNISINDCGIDLTEVSYHIMVQLQDTTTSDFIIFNNIGIRPTTDRHGLISNSAGNGAVVVKNCVGKSIAAGGNSFGLIITDEEKLLELGL